MRPTPECMRTLSPEELAKAKPLTSDELGRAIKSMLRGFDPGVDRAVQVVSNTGRRADGKDRPKRKRRKRGGPK